MAIVNAEALRIDTGDHAGIIHTTAGGISVILPAAICWDKADVIPSFC